MFRSARGANYLAARTGIEFMRAGPVLPRSEEKRLYEKPREAAKSGSKRLITLNFNVKQPILFNMPKPKPTTFEVRKSKPFCGKVWRVTGYVDAKRKQFWYATEKQARAEAAWRNQERSAYGSKVNLDSELRLEAYRANELLKPHNKTILDAVNYYRAHLNTLASSVSFSVLAEKIRAEYKRRRENNETSDRNVETLESTLKKLERRFAAELVCNIRTEDLREWLTALPLAAKTRNTIRGYVRLVFTHAVDYGYTPANPALAIKKFRERYNEGEAIGILSAEDTEKLFRAAHPELIPFLTLWFFTGIRRRTLEKLDWSDVHLSEKRIIVPRHHGKNQRRYRVTLSENALEWLKPYEKESGSLLAISKAPQSRGKPSEERTRDLIVAAAKEAGITLPDNVGRNTFISMHVAYHESIDKTALEADNSSEIIKKDYLDLVTREEAEKFWNIRSAAAPAPASVAEDMPESKEEQHAAVTLRTEFLDVQAKHAVAPIAFRETQRDFKRYAAVIAATSVEDIKIGTGEVFRDEKDLRSFLRWILRGAPGHKPPTAKVAAA